MASVKRNIAIIFAVGIVAGGIVTSAILYPQLRELKAEYTTLNNMYSIMKANTVVKDVALATNVSTQDNLEQDIEKLTQTLKKKNEIIAASEKRIIDVTKEHAGKIKKNQDVIDALKQRLQNTDELYAERFYLSVTLNNLNERILKSSYKAEQSQKACDEFKEGNSWNMVSDEDCDNFNMYKQQSTEMITEFDILNGTLDAVNRQLSAFGHLPVIKKNS